MASRDVDGAVAMGKDFRKRELLSIVGGDSKHHHMILNNLLENYTA